MIIVSAEFPAGLTIREACRSAVEFAARNKCLVKAEINDVPMIFSASPVLVGMKSDQVEDSLADYYVRQYEREMNLKYGARKKLRSKGHKPE